MEEKWLKAEVLRIQDETENTKRFFFRIPELNEFQFKPGQFITLDLPISEKKGKRQRSYSIASAPDGNEFELVIVYADHGAASAYLWKEVQPGSMLSFKGPQGRFTLPEKIETDICLIATGTGIAPFRSMLEDLVNRPRPTKKIYLIFGTRYLKDVLYLKEMQELEKKIPGFQFILTLSRESSPDYKGKRGYVHQVYEEIFADQRPAEFYLCGWRNMVDEARNRIIEMGYEHRSVHREVYGTLFSPVTAHNKTDTGT